ncbi:unnamed protein product [Candidula unifasciata]|uniref:Endoplasmic reticulum oxidoreductin-1-like protein n=1 Tax=Candidula unifasciata TaxID=100452 RepID=A0A8S3ZD98_9EUPU|nr:unnamed protein product [Candidula unifasciata]
MEVYVAFTLFLVFLVEQSNSQYSSSKWSRDIADRCFCKLKGEVNDCSCKVETLDLFNNNKVFPRLKSLLARNYFRFFRVNLNKGCPFWPQDNRCSVRDCHVELCSEEEVPIKRKLEVESGHEEQKQKYFKVANEIFEESCALETELSALDKSISAERENDFQTWRRHDGELPLFCEIDDEQSSDAEYVDLSRNPERYTGYRGSSPHRIWKSIYEENCFKPEVSLQNLSKHYGKDTDSGDALCLEKRVFFHLISGLHTSINVHLSDNYHFSAKAGIGASSWDHNLNEFLTRFDPELTNGQGPERLKNLYFAYLIELRALDKAVPYLSQEDFYTGDQSEDGDLKDGILDLLSVIRSFPDHYNEKELFKGNTMEKKQLKAEFVQHFHNISRIMDCVECDKCRLWGKLQILGMGTALKILFSEDISTSEFQLTRTEIVALFNAFGRLSSSIYAIETFRKLSGQPIKIA